MRRIVVFAILLAAFLIAMYLLPAVWTNLFLLTIAMSLAVTVLWSYRRYTYEALTTKDYTHGHVLVLGIIAAWTAFIFIEVISIINQFTDVPDRWMELYTQGLFFLNIAAACLHLSARGMQEESPVIWRNRWRSSIVAMLVGIVLGGVLAALLARQGYFESGKGSTDPTSLCIEDAANIDAGGAC